VCKYTYRHKFTYVHIHMHLCAYKVVNHTIILKYIICSVIPIAETVGKSSKDS